MLRFLPFCGRCPSQQTMLLFGMRACPLRLGTLLLLLTLHGRAQAQATSPLPLNDAIEEQMSAPGSKTFTVMLIAGEFLVVSVEDKGINFSLELRGPDGAVMVKSNRHPAWIETISCEASKAGAYQVVLAGPNVKLSGGYRLRALRREAPTEQDRVQMQANRLSQEAWDESHIHNPTGLNSALSKSVQATALWKELGNENEIAYMQLIRASTNRYLGQHAKTLAAATEAVAAFQKTKNAAGQTMAARTAGVAQAMVGHPEQAAKLFREAVGLASTLNDMEALAGLYADLGAALGSIPHVEDAMTALHEGLSISRRLGSSQHEAALLSNLGELTSHLGHYDEAIVYSKQAVAIYRRSGNQYLEGIALLTLGEAYERQALNPEASEAFGRSLAIRRKLGDLDGIASALEYLADANISQGHYDDAIAELNELQSIQSKTDSRLILSPSLATLARVYQLTGHSDKALEFYEKALEVSREQGQIDKEADQLYDLGDLFLQLGQDDRAIEYAKRALTLYGKEQDVFGALPLETLGEAYLHKGQVDQAIYNFQRRVNITHQHKQAEWESSALTELAVAKQEKGLLAEALKDSQRALLKGRQAQNPNVEGAALNELGSLYEQMGRAQEAKTVLNQSLVLYERLRSDADISTVLYHLARVAQKQGHLEEAQTLVEKSLRFAEEMRARLYNPVSRLTWFSSVQKANNLFINILMTRHLRQPDRGFSVLAFEAAERGRARTLLDLLHESSVDLQQDGDPALVKEEKQLADQVNALEADRFKRLVSKQASGIDTLDRSIEDLRLRLEYVQGEIRRTNYRYATVTQLFPIELRQIQDELDDNTLLLEYSLGEKSFVWTVGRNSLRCYPLGSGKNIEEAAKRAYGLITARGKFEAQESPAVRQVRISAADRQFLPAVRQLSTIVLRPIKSEVRPQKRLIIVSDGALDYVPFSLLSTGTKDFQPLILRHEITMLPSASTIVVQRQLLAKRPAAPKDDRRFRGSCFHFGRRQAGEESSNYPTTITGASHRRNPHAGACRRYLSHAWRSSDNPRHPPPAVYGNGG